MRGSVQLCMFARESTRSVNELLHAFPPGLNFHRNYICTQGSPALTTGFVHVCTCCRPPCYLLVTLPCLGLTIIIWASSKNIGMMINTNLGDSCEFLNIQFWRRLTSCDCFISGHRTNIPYNKLECCYARIANN